MFTWIFWKATIERAIWTVSQTAIALTLVSSPLELSGLDWKAIGIASLLAGGLSVVKSLGVAGATNGSPSTTSAEQLSTPISENVRPVG